MSAVRTDDVLLNSGMCARTAESALEFLRGVLTYYSHHKTAVTVNVRESIMEVAKLITIVLNYEDLYTTSGILNTIIYYGGTASGKKL